ncbi:MAG: phosphatase [Clostridia bacterium]|nr:phosphatase [Clostridia bacterium]
MNILVDTHCHTIASTHAYSTVKELAEEAEKKGMEAIAITDHAVEIPDAPHMWHFENLKTIPRKIGNVKILYGVEANILDLDGAIDMPDYILKRLDIVIASIHTPVYRDVGSDDHTSAYLGVLDNPYVDILGHTGSPNLMYDHEAVLTKAKRLHKLIEINAHSFIARKSNIENCRKIALKCKELGVGIVVNSDAHICFDVGEFGSAKQMLSEIDFPEELVMNTTLDKLQNYLKPRKTILNGVCP